MEGAFIKLPLLLCLIVGVNGGGQILSSNAVSEDGILSIQCNADIADVPTEVTTVDFMTLFKNSKAAPAFSVLAQYRSTAPPSINKTIINKPPNANWRATFTGHDAGKEMRNSMKIQIDVKDVECRDAGSYICQVKFFMPEATEAETKNSTTEDLIVGGLNRTFSLTYDPKPVNTNPENPNHLMYEDGHSVSLICKLTWMQGFHLAWKVFVENPDHQGYTQVPVASPPASPPPVPQPNPAGCMQYTIMSTLTAVVKAQNLTVYQCLIHSDKDTEMAVVDSRNFTLSTPVVASAVQRLTSNLFVLLFTVTVTVMTYGFFLHVTLTLKPAWRELFG